VVTRFVSSDPAEATLLLRGPRRALLLAERTGPEVRIDAYLARLGRRTFLLEDATLDGLGEATVKRITPERVRLDLAPVPAPAEPADEPEQRDP